MVVEFVKSIGEKTSEFVVGRKYLLVGIDDDNYRVMTDGLKPFVYPRTCFAPPNLTPPAGWLRITYEGGEYESYDPDSGGKAVVMGMFDGDPDATAQFANYVAKKVIEHPEILLSQTAAGTDRNG